MNDLIVKYPECLVEYVPIIEGKIAVRIECQRDNSPSKKLSDIEKSVDIRRAKRAGCRGIAEICYFLNGDTLPQ
uniref:Uncharacterized protein n=1 Tax=viral metagenome TaxID=1070528 RepID=A0A6M3LJQ1_9ZZZZ